VLPTRVVTIGVYGFTVDRFLTALREAGVDALLDVRQRRGVRGSELSCSADSTNPSPPPCCASRATHGRVTAA
jgi:hypothetical protein